MTEANPLSFICFLTIGSKFEHNEFSCFEVLPNARLQWGPASNQILWAAVSRAVRTPTPIEKDLTRTLATGAGVRVAFAPNDNFESEQLTAYELGYRNRFTSHLSTDITAFYDDYDKLQTVAVGSLRLITIGANAPYQLIPVMFTNDMKGVTHKIEASINWTVKERLKLAFDYSVLKLSVTALNPTQEGAALLYPKHKVGVKILWNIGSTWTLDTIASRTDHLLGGDIDAYTLLDLNFGGQLSKKLRLNVVGQIYYSAPIVNWVVQVILIRQK